MRWYDLSLATPSYSRRVITTVSSFSALPCILKSTLRPASTSASALSASFQVYGVRSPGRSAYSRRAS